MNVKYDEDLVNSAMAVLGAPETFRKGDFVAAAASMGFAEKAAHDQVNKYAVRVSRGVYRFDNCASASVSAPNVLAQAPEPEAVVNQAVPAAAGSVMSIVNDEVFIPEKDNTFVRWGHFAKVKKIISSRQFFPVYIFGMSGNGKTFMVEQACAQSGREYVRVQITPETDEDDLIGGFRLINGETVFAKGPVIKAMEAGAVLLVDEIDRGSNKLMSLQGVLEGKPVLIKKTGQLIKPAPGFNIIATGNTQGQGDDDGRYVAATVLDDAFLERFYVAFDQPYPSEAVERKIALNHMKKFDCVDESFADTLVRWGVSIRKSFLDGAIDDLISTRRICHIIQTYSIFGDQNTAIELCVSRFEADTRDAFMDFWSKMQAEEPAAPSNGNENDDDLIPF